MNLFKFLIALVLLSFASCGSGGGGKKLSENQIDKPNIVLIMADDLGYGDIECYGSNHIKTPNLNRLAAEGIKFSDFHSNGPVCSPTRAALMTGMYQQRTGVEGVITAASHRHVGLSIDEITLADELKKLGYTCGIFGKWHLGYAPEFNPSLQGFDEFVGFVSGNVDYHAHIDQEGYLDWWNDRIINNEEGYTTDLISDYGVEFIEKNMNHPFFLYLPHEAPHGPFQRRVDRTLRVVGKRGSAKVPRDSIPMIYKEMIEVMDEGIGRIMQALKDNGIEKNTIVIFCSDNGGTRYGSNGVLKGFKAGVYEGGHRVPAIIWYPEAIKAGTVSDEKVMSMDFLPTILDFIGVVPSGDKIDGISIKNLLLNGDPLPERDLYWCYGNKNAIRSGDWKLVSRIVNGEKVTELFNLQDDISEKNDLSSENPELIQMLSQKLIIWQKEVRAGVKLISK